MRSEWLDNVADRRAVTHDQLDDLRRRIATLRYEYQLVLLLRGSFGVSWETTALVLDRSVHAAHCVQSRARRALIGPAAPHRGNDALTLRGN